MKIKNMIQNVIHTLPKSCTSESVGDKISIHQHPAFIISESEVPADGISANDRACTVL
jgi:hypothetical protein